MKKIILSLLVLFIPIGVAAQCSPGGGGTQCQGPLAIMPGNGQSATATIVLTPATPSAPCVRLAGSGYDICGQNNQITVDFGDSKGFVDMKGKDGIDGKDGVNGRAATVSIGSVTSGSAPAVTDSGTPTDAILNFVLQKGADGVTAGNTLTGTLTCPKGKGTVQAGFVSLGCTFKITVVK